MSLAFTARRCCTGRSGGGPSRSAAASGWPTRWAFRWSTDFRAADVAAGGQGAPLVPLYHAALARGLPRPLAVLNIGGVANVTWIGEDGAEPPLLAFDTGPGNALLDDFMRTRTGRPFDAGGELAARGQHRRRQVMAWLRQPWFRRPPPKSLDRDDFRFVLDAVAAMPAADGAATLAAFTARAVAFALPLLPEPPRRWLVCGGGRHNRLLMALLRGRPGRAGRSGGGRRLARRLHRG